ncbi:hypothetical protein AURDEDRAFT_164163 [Auricularia subglabra TFB-10046 SS5]|nr:hypothetical protein AURDEDRAFT_164163 [Auricularia subglabra TFB-10046 SS5]
MLLVWFITRGHSGLVTRAIGSATRHLSSEKATHNLAQLGNLQSHMQLKAHDPFHRANDVLSSGLGFYNHRGLFRATSGIWVYTGTVPIHAPGTFVSRSRCMPGLRSVCPCNATLGWFAPAVAVSRCLTKPFAPLRISTDLRIALPSTQRRKLPVLAVRGLEIVSIINKLRTVVARAAILALLEPGTPPRFGLGRGFWTPP